MEQEVSANRKYKDSLFSRYMCDDPRRLIEVYNAIAGTHYPLDTPLDFNTLDGVLFNNRVNDISFTLDNRFIILIEHQSTLNENMPLRMLLYLGRLYEKILENKNIYRKKRIPLPVPEFIVLYNGRSSCPKESYLKLSDAFMDQSRASENTLDLTVKVLNIKYNENRELVEKSRALCDYSCFIDLVQKHLRDGSELKDAIRNAARECETRRIMQPFLKEHISEVENMLNVEWNLEDALQIEREEGREEGLQEGRKEGLQKGLQEGLQKGLQDGRKEGIDIGIKQSVHSLSRFFPADQIAQMLEIPLEQVNLSLGR